MPILFDEPPLPEATVRAIARELIEELEAIRGSIAERGTPKDPLGIVTAQDLLSAAIALGRATREAPLPLTIAVVNVQYESLLAAIDLIKTHFGLPTVPRGRPAAG